MSRAIQISIVLMLMGSCDSDKKNPSRGGTPPRVEPTATSLAGDEDFMGLAGNCLQGNPTKEKLLEDEKVLNSLAAITFSPTSERARRLSELLKLTGWKCSAP